MEKLGILDVLDSSGQNKSNKFSYKFSVINYKSRNTIDHAESNHAMTI